NQVEIDFLDALAKHFKPNEYFEFGVLSCFSGTNKFIGAVCAHFKKKGFKNFLIGGYRNDYQTRYIFEIPSGRILEWTDKVLDRKDEKTEIQAMRKGQIPKYETKCQGPNTPQDPLDF